MALTLHGTVSDNTVALDRPKVQPIVINGDMQVAQRGDQTGITAGQYINIDRFFINMINLGTWSFTQSTDTPTGLGFSKSLKIDCTTADASPAAGDNFYLSMQSEGRNVQGFEKGTSDAKTSTLAYWIKCNKTGNYVVELWDRTNDRHVAVLKTISSADTWEKVVCNFPADTTGALANTSARSIMISWAFDSGTDFTSGTLPSTWASRSDANRFVGTNLGLGDNTANEVLITGVQWEVGTYDANSIPPFQFEDVATSLARCQRYFQYFPSGSAGRWNSATQAECAGNFPVPMRAVPTLSINPSNNTCHIFRIGISTNAVTVSSVASHLMGDTGGVAQIVVSSTASTPSAGDFAMYDTDGSDNVVFCDSEL